MLKGCVIMKKIVCYLLVFLTITVFYTTAFSVTIVTYGGTFSSDDDGYQTFLKEHPNISLAWPDKVYTSTSAFTTALLTRQYNCDMFTWGTSQVDWSILMDKGYCFNLSDSQVLVDAVNRMHPNIAKLAMHDGILYAIPHDMNFIFMQIDEDTWFEAGLTLDDIPQSFPEFLDFLEHWCDRIEAAPESKIRILCGWESNYTESSYTAWLTKLLIDEAIMQMQFAGEALHFDNPELLALLERCDTVGKRIYHLESPNGELSLFDESSRDIWPTNYANVVCLRQSSTQPKLIKSVVNMWAICSYTDNPELCLELLEKIVAGPGDPTSPSDMFLYRDAQARIRSDYESDIAHWSGELNAVIALLQKPDLNGEDKFSLEEKRIRYEGAVERTEQNKWLMTPEQLATYQSAADELYFPIPSIFDESNSQGTMENLYNQFSSHRLTAEQFLEELNHIAQMIRLED